MTFGPALAAPDIDCCWIADVFERGDFVLRFVLTSLVFGNFQLCLEWDAVHLRQVLNLQLTDCMAKSTELTATNLFCFFARIAHVEVVEDHIAFMDTFNNFKLGVDLFTVTARRQRVLQFLCNQDIPTCRDWTHASCIWFFLCSIEIKLGHVYFLVSCHPFIRWVTMAV